MTAQQKTSVLIWGFVLMFSFFYVNSFLIVSIKVPDPLERIFLQERASLLEDSKRITSAYSTPAEKPGERASWGKAWRRLFMREGLNAERLKG